MQKQMDEVQAAAATATTDAAGLLSGLLSGQMQVSIELPPKESMAPAMPEESLRTRIIKTAIAAVQSGEFMPSHVYYNPAGTYMPQPCGCAIAALCYGGVKLGLHPDESAGQYTIHSRMRDSGFRVRELSAIEMSYESLDRGGLRSNDPFPQHADHMVQCLSGLLEKE